MPAMRSMCALLVSALVFVVCLPSHASAFTSYRVTQQVNHAQSAATYSGTMTRQWPLGPFTNKAAMVSPLGTDDLYASWWQIPITLPNIPGVSPATPFVFPFFGVNYTQLTITSKGFLYLGSYPSATDLSNLTTAQYAPSYNSSAPSSTGFPAIAGVQRPVISFMHNAGGAVSMVSLAGVTGTSSTAACQAGTAVCQLSNYYYSVMPPISSYNSVTGTGSSKVTTLITLTPLNSNGTTADGYRLVLAGLQLRDVTGMQASVILILYQSGLIEIYYYQIQPSATAPVSSVDDYPTTPTGTTTPLSADSGVGFASVGIQGTPVGGQTAAYTLASPTVSQQTFAQMQTAVVGSAISFRPQ